MRKLSQKSRIQQNSRFDFLFDQITKVFQYQLPTSMPPMTAESPATSDKITNDSTVVRSPQQDDAQTNSQKGSDNDPFRTSVGRGMEKFTTLINDNIITARFGVFATISLLTIYGISNTPLFFRYRSIAEIPNSYFVGRRRLYCRIIGVHREAKSSNETKGIQILVRHLSPIGTLLPTSWFEYLMRMSPSNRKVSRDPTIVDDKVVGGNRELLKLQIAGVQKPPLSRSSYDPEEFLSRLAKKRALVSCQLLGRRIVVPEEDNEKQHQKPLEILGDNFHAADNENLSNVSEDLDDYQAALCHIAYRPHWQLLTTDMAEALVTAGNATVASDVLNYTSLNHNGDSEKMFAGSLKTKIIDTSQRIHDIRRDVKYMDALKKSEFQAAQSSKGMWSDPEVRRMKKEIINEVEFQAKASPLQKIWRMIRGG